MGPPPRSLTAEANSCFMVRVPHGPNRIQGCGASIAPERGLPSDQLYRTSNNEGHRVAVTLDTKVLIQGGGDPNTAMALKPCPEWARRLGASPQKRIVASWSGSCMDPTEYKVAARASRPSVGSPRINYTEPRTMKDIELQ